MDSPPKVLFDSENSSSDETSSPSPPPKAGKKRSRKKVRPSVDPDFVGRGARDLYHEERGFIRCWMRCHPEESRRDVAARFNVGVGVIAALAASKMCAYEKCIQNRHGRRPQFEESISKRLALIDEVREAYESPAKVKARLEELGVKVSISTIRADFLDLGIMARRKRMSPWRGGDPDAWAARRLKFCKAVKALGPEAVASLCFSDESIIRCTNKGEFCWCLDDEITEDIQCNRWAANCHVWACIGRGNFLVWVDVSGRNLKALDYQEFMKKNFKAPYKAQKKQFKESIFMQDGASIHRASVSELEKMKINVLPDWPSHSPDLNPIETLWAIMKRDIGHIVGQDLSQTKANKQRIRDVVKEWFDTLKEKRPEFIDALVSGFADRLDECIELKGGLTRY